MNSSRKYQENQSNQIQSHSSQFHSLINMALEVIQNPIFIIFIDYLEMLNLNLGVKPITKDYEEIKQEPVEEKPSSTRRRLVDIKGNNDADPVSNIEPIEPIETNSNRRVRAKDPFESNDSYDPFSRFSGQQSKDLKSKLVYMQK